MSTLQIVFDVEEKHVGACLVALEGKARNLNFKIVQEAEWNKNRPPKAKRTTAVKEEALIRRQRLFETISAYPKGIEFQALVQAAKTAGIDPRGVWNIAKSLVKAKAIKKVGKTYTVSGGLPNG